MRKNSGLSDAQKEILRAAGFMFEHLAEEELATVIDPTFDTAAMGDEKLLEFLELANIFYRAGDQLIPMQSMILSSWQNCATGCPSILICTPWSRNH